MSKRKIAVINLPKRYNIIIMSSSIFIIYVTHFCNTLNAEYDIFKI